MDALLVAATFAAAFQVAAVLVVVGGASAAQGTRGGGGRAGGLGAGGTGAGGGGGVPLVEAEALAASPLRFPRGLLSFEELAPGRSAAQLEGWELGCADPSLFSARTAEEVVGGIQGRPGSQRWLRVRDLDTGDVRNGFCTNAILSPEARNYRVSFALCVEALEGRGPSFPCLVVQHLGPAGHADAFGLELAEDGLYLVVRGLGGDPARTRLADWSGPTALGRWIEGWLAVDFDRGELSAALNGGVPARLGVSPRRGLQPTNLRLAYRADGPGNAATVLLDDLALAFGASVCEESLVIGFETEDDFATGLVNGQDLSTPPEFGNLFALSGAGANLGPAIFDSTPSGPNDPSQDRDLLVGLGNLVILQNDQAATQTAAGVFDRPNDDQDGGTLRFAFTRPLEVLALDLVDIDQGPVQRATVTLTDVAGRTRVYSVPNGFTEDVLVNGPPGHRTLDTTTLLPQAGFTASATAVQDAGFLRDQVVLLAVQLGSSGALDNLELRLPCVVLDFETEDDGASVLVNGQDVSTPPEFGALVAIAGSGPNAGAAIFDSTPGGPNDPSQDTDLLVGLGNLLVLQNDNAASSLVQTVPGVFDRPNDDSDGGRLLFTFLAPAEPRNIDLVDIDPGLPNASNVVLTDVNGRKRTYTVPAGWTEDLVTHGAPGFRTLDLRALLPQPGFQGVATVVEDAGYDPGRVLTLAVNLGSSGAVDNLCFCP